MPPLDLDFSEDFAAAEQRPVHGPLYIRTTPAGALEILCYRMDGNDAIPTVIHFVPDAAGQLVHDLHTSVSNGAIKLMILREEQAMQ